MTSELMLLGADTLTPVTDALPCPVMLWQFAIECIIEDGIDFNMLNPDPAIASALLNRLAFPPA